MYRDEVVIAEFTAPEVSRIVGMKYDHLYSWMRRDFFNPSLRGTRGKSIQQLYSWTDVIEIRAIMRLKDLGVSLQKLRKVKHVLQGLNLSVPYTYLILTGSGDLVAEVGPDAVMSLLKQPGQLGFNVVNVAEVVAEVEPKALEVLRSRNAGTRIKEAVSV